MAGVIADLVHIGRDLSGDLVVFLQIDGQGRCRLSADLFEGGGLFRVVHGDADDASPGRLKLVNLGYGRINIVGLGGTHALDSDRRAATNLYFADPYRPRGHSLHTWLLLPVRLVPQSSRGHSGLQPSYDA